VPAMAHSGELVQGGRGCTPRGTSRELRDHGIQHRGRQKPQQARKTSEHRAGHASPVGRAETGNGTDPRGAGARRASGGGLSASSGPLCGGRGAEPGGVRTMPACLPGGYATRCCLRTGIAEGRVEGGSERSTPSEGGRRIGAVDRKEKGS